MNAQIRADAGERYVSWRNEIAACRTSYDLFLSVRKISDAAGYRHFCFANLTDLPLARLADHLLISNLPPEFIRRYDGLGRYGSSPTIRQLATTVEPLLEPDMKQAEMATGTPQTEYLELLEQFDFQSAIFFPLRAASGSKGGAVMIGPADLGTARLLELHCLSTLIYDRLVRGSGFPDDDKDALLTKRERSCLRWTAAGKTSTEIGMILGISVHTVDHYLSTASQKLGTVNRAHAVATALRRGLID